MTENDATKTRWTAVARAGAIEISCLVKDHFGVGAATVAVGRKVVKYFFIPSAARVWSQFEDDAPGTALGAAIAGGSVDVTRLVKRDLVPRALPVGVAVQKAVPHLQGPASRRESIGREFKD